MAVQDFLKKAKAIEDAHKESPSKKHESSAGHSGEHDESNWLTSYADMMTLLCGFFVMMFSLSKMDQPQFESVRKAVSEQFGGKYVSPTEEMGKFMTQVIQEAGVEKNAIIYSDAYGTSVTFQSSVFFDSLSAELRPEGAKVLNRFIRAVRAKEKELKKPYRIVVERHTDSLPIRSDSRYASNWELSASRAARVVRLFLDHQFDRNRLVAMGYADTRPQATDRTPAGQVDPRALAKNRRVVIRILEPQTDSVLDQPTQKQEPSAQPPSKVILKDSQAVAPETQKRPTKTQTVLPSAPMKIPGVAKPPKMLSPSPVEIPQDSQMSAVERGLSHLPQAAPESQELNSDVTPEFVPHSVTSEP